MAQSLESIQDEILDRIHAGETVSRQATIEAHPEHADALSAFFDVIAIFEGSAGADLAPASLGEFCIVREIARGGMGIVYEARQTSLNRKVALKVLSPTMKLDERNRRRFRREAEAAGRLRHPGIVPVFAVGEAAGTPFFAMELVRGETLRDHLRARAEEFGESGPPDFESWERWAVETVIQVADAIAYAHSQGILHRDVKPANIMLDESGQARLTDFGLAQDLAAPGLTQTGEVVGSPQYMSPEQALRRDAPVDERTDVYSLAVTLYEMLTFRMPYEANTSAEYLTALVAGDVVPVRRANPQVSKGLAGVLARALQRNPKDRYRSATSFADDLHAALEGRPTRSRSMWWASRRRMVGLALFGMLACAALAWWLLGRDDDRDADRRAGRPGEHGGEQAAARASPMDVEAILARYEGAAPRTQSDYQRAIRDLRWQDTEAARLALHMVFSEYVQGPGKDDREARVFLGYREFRHPIPEAVLARELPHVRAVERANEKRWFGRNDDEVYERAQRAWELTREHARRAQAGPQGQAMEGALARLSKDKALEGLCLAVRIVHPFVFCVASKHCLSEFDVARLPLAGERARARRYMASDAARAQAMLDDMAAVVVGVHDEFVRRYVVPLGLEPVGARYGGRPDLASDRRAFKGGYPLVVCAFDGVAAAKGFFQTRGLPAHLVNFFDHRTGVLGLTIQATSSRGRDAEIQWCALLAASQLLHAHARQQQGWARLQPRLDWVAVGLPEYLGSAELTTDGKVRIRGVRPDRLGTMNSAKKGLERTGRSYPLFPLRALVHFSSVGAAGRRAAAQWKLNPSFGASLFFEQAMALTHFLQEAEGGLHRERFTRALKAWLAGKDVASVARALLGDDPHTEETWTEIQSAYERHLRSNILGLDPKSIESRPAPRGRTEER